MLTYLQPYHSLFSPAPSPILFRSSSHGLGQNCRSCSGWTPAFCAVQELYRNQKQSPKPAWGSSELSAPLCAWRGVGKSRNLAAGCHMSASIPQVRWLHLGYILVNDYDTFRKLNSEQLLTQHVTLLGPVLRLCVNHQEPGFPTKLFRLHAKSRENGVSMAALPLKGPSGSDFFGTWRCSSPLADQVQRHIVLVSKLE